MCSIDISLYALKQSRIFDKNLYIIQADIRYIDSIFKKSIFNGVIALDVLEHLDNIESILKKISKILKNDGFLFISTCNWWSIGRFIKGNKWHGYRDPTHHLESIISPYQYYKILKKLDFRIIRIGSNGLWDFPYFKYFKKLQSLLFNLSRIIQYKLRRIIEPPLGETLWIIAQKKSKKLKM